MRGPCFGMRGSLLACLGGIGVSALGCEGSSRSGPIVPPGHFLSLTIYDVNVFLESVPEASRLAAVPHMQLGPRRTRRLFAEFKYHWFALWSWEWMDEWKTASCLGLVRTADGREIRVLLIGPTVECFAIAGQRGYYAPTGSSQAMADMLSQVFLERVLCPVGRRRPSEEKANLVPFETGGKYGYLDRSGAVAIEARFDDAMPFSEGLAAVRVGDADDGQWGYIDPSGRFVIEPRFAGASFFSEGLAAVTVGDFFDLYEGKQGYINRAGEMVIEPRFETAWPFADGVATVCVGRKMLSMMKASYINTKGEFVERPPRSRKGGGLKR